jgi:hypothetical protein
MSCYSRNEPVRHAVAEGNEGYCHEGRNCISNVTPIDLSYLANHQTTHLRQHDQPSLNKNGRWSMFPTRMSVQPVAQGGIDAKIGAKKSEMRKQKPVMIAVKPVRPPSAMPAPLSMNAVTGEQPKSEPMDMHTASVQYASVERGKSPSVARVLLQKRAIEYNVAVQSTMSTYRNVNSARMK